MIGPLVKDGFLPSEDSSLKWQAIWFIILGILACLGFFILAMREFLQAKMSNWGNYFSSKENLLQLTILMGFIGIILNTTEYEQKPKFEFSVTIY